MQSRAVKHLMQMPRCRSAVASAIVMAVIAPVDSVPWQSVAIGGGGYVTGIVVTPQTATSHAIYFRTDVGGAYVSNGANRSAWIPLTDQWTYDKKNLYGVSSLAVTGDASPRLLMAAGGYLDQSPSGIFVLSTSSQHANGIPTWTQLTPADWPVRVGGNDYTHTERASGERLATNMPAGDAIIFGSEIDGLWRSGDGGATWQQTACDIVPCDNTTAAEDGVNMVAFDPRNANIAVASLYGVGMMVSYDAGITWSQPVGGGSTGPTLVNRCAWGSAAAASGSSSPSTAAGSSSGMSSLFCAGVDGAWTADASFTWTRITTLPYPSNTSYFGIDVSPHDASGLTLIVMAYATGGPLRVCISTDGGATWTPLLQPVSLNMLPWDQDNITDLSKSSAAANIKWEPDPAFPNRVYIGNWYSVWVCEDITAALAKPTPGRTVWSNIMPGHEEVFVLSASAPPAGPLLLTGTADLGGFQHDANDTALPNGLSSYPTLSYGHYSSDGGEGTGSDYTEDIVTVNGSASYPSLLARSQFVPWDKAGGEDGSGVVQTSKDGGATWQLAAGFPPHLIPLRVSVAAHAPAILVALVQEGYPMATVDGGATWANVTGLPAFAYTPLSGNRYNMSSPLTSVRDNGSNGSGSSSGSGSGSSVLFYYADCGTGTVYSSVDGLTFTPVASGTTASAAASISSPPASNRCQLLSMPLSSGTPPPAAGTLWLAAGAAGLWSSSDGGATWSQAPGIADAHNIAFGSGQLAGGYSYPVLYVYGSTSGAQGSAYSVYASKGPAYAAGSWVPLGDESGSNGLGDWSEVMTASRREGGGGYGVVVMGSFGRGAFWTNASQVLDAAE